MSLSDSIRRKRIQPTHGADPAQAFGAEELTMEEIRRQTFVPPEKKGPNFAQRAGAALSQLRTRIVGEEPDDLGFGSYPEAESPAQPAEEAPVYSARSYQDERAPDLGWENPFAEPSSGTTVKTAPPSPPERRASRSYKRRRETPVPPAYPQADSYYAPAYPEDTAYPPADAGPSPYGDGYGYETDFYGNPAAYAPGPETWGPDPYGQEAYAYPESYPEEPAYSTDHGTWYGADRMPPPPSRRRSAPAAMEPGDFKYMFWSGGIVLSMILTLVSFIYGCVI